jgi:hypothetical protein
MAGVVTKPLPLPLLGQQLLLLDCRDEPHHQGFHHQSSVQQAEQ